MSVPLFDPDIEYAYQCVEWILQQITNANGYYTDGAVVGREQDPRALVKDRQEDYNDKMVALTIVHVNRVRDSDHSVGGVDAWKVTFNVLGLTTLAVEEDQAAKPLLLKQKVFRIENDIRIAFGKNRHFVASAAAVNAPNRPRVSDFRVNAFFHANKTLHPDAAFAAICTLILKEVAGVN